MSPAAANPPPSWRWRLATLVVAFVLACAASMLMGCTQAERQAASTGHTRRVVRSWTDPSGVTTTLEESWTETAEEAKERRGLDPAAMAGLQQAGGAVMAAARGDMAQTISLGVGALATIAAAWAGAKAKGESRRAEEHKADAAEGWAKFERMLEQRKAPPA